MSGSTKDVQFELAKKKLCVCCESDLGKHPDYELDGHVCDDCHYQLRGAVAFLRMPPVNVRGCIKAKVDATGNPVGDNREEPIV